VSEVLIRGLLKVLHPSDVITRLSIELRMETVLTNMSLTGRYTHGLLLFNPVSAYNFPSIKLLDIISTSDIIKEFTFVHKDPPIIYIVKQSFGVQKALADVRAIKPTTVLHSLNGVKNFWVILDESKASDLVRLVKKYAIEVGEKETRVRLKIYKKLKSLDYSFLRFFSTNFREYFIVGGRNYGASKLTFLEYYVLRRAYELGYFDWPRRCSLTCLSADIGLSKATLSEHLRTAIRKLLNEYFEQLE